MGAKLSFELDAGKILAKLHRGGCQLHKNIKDLVYINTGIINDANINPEEVDKNSINFDMEGNEYELGVILSKEAIAKLADAKKIADDDKGNKKEENSIQQNQDAKSDNKTDNAKTDSAKQDKAAEEKKEKIDKNTPITQNPDEKKTNESFLFEDYTKMTPTPIDKATLELMNTTPEAVNSDSIAKIASGAKEEAKKAIEKNRDIIKKFMEDNMHIAVTYLQEYLKVFAGEDAAKVDAKNVSVTYVPDEFADPYKNKKYNNYQIPALTDEEMRQEKIKQLQQMKKTGDNTIKFKNMCFKIAYSLDIGK